MPFKTNTALPHSRFIELTQPAKQLPAFSLHDYLPIPVIMNNTSTSSTAFSAKVSCLQNSIEDDEKFILFTDLYDRFAPAFYGEIKRNLYQQEICNQTLTDAYKHIWESITSYDKTMGGLFAWCFRIVRKEIHKKKVELALKEIFACQHYIGKDAEQHHQRPYSQNF
jgi:hypothetical protein